MDMMPTGRWITVLYVLAHVLSARGCGINERVMAWHSKSKRYEPALVVIVPTNIETGLFGVIFAGDEDFCRRNWEVTDRLSGTGAACLLRLYEMKKIDGTTGCDNSLDLNQTETVSEENDVEEGENVGTAAAFIVLIVFACLVSCACLLWGYFRATAVSDKDVPDGVKGTKVQEARRHLRKSLTKVGNWGAGRRSTSFRWGLPNSLSRSSFTWSTKTEPG